MKVMMTRLSFPHFPADIWDENCFPPGPKFGNSCRSFVNILHRYFTIVGIVFPSTSVFIVPLALLRIPDDSRWFRAISHLIRGNIWAQNPCHARVEDIDFLSGTSKYFPRLTAGEMTRHNLENPRWARDILKNIEEGERGRKREKEEGGGEGTVWKINEKTDELRMLRAADSGRCWREILIDFVGCSRIIGWE